LDRIIKIRIIINITVIIGLTGVSDGKKPCLLRTRNSATAMSVRILSTVETTCTTNPQQIEWSWRVTVDGFVSNSHDSIVVQVSSTSSTVDDNDDEFC